MAEVGPADPTPEQRARHAATLALIGRPSSSGRVRFLVALGGGLLVALGVSVGVAPRYGVLVGLMTTCAVYVVWSYLALRSFDGHATKLHSRQEDTGAALADVGGFVVVVANLAAIVTLLVLNHDHRAEAADALLALGGVLLSWFLLHTLYVPRYAELYYRVDDHPPATEPDDTPTPVNAHVPPVMAGIDFNAPGYWPEYGDFTYFSFNLGMTYQVSDTSVCDPRIRRLVLHHCLLSYFFATLITAAVLNLVLGLVS